VVIQEILKYKLTMVVYQVRLLNPDKKLDRVIEVGDGLGREGPAGGGGLHPQAVATIVTTGRFHRHRRDVAAVGCGSHVHHRTGNGTEGLIQHLRLELQRAFVFVDGAFSLQ